MYGVVREFQPPLGVTHAVRGHFGTSSSLATVFARKNSIDLYVVRANDETARLELISSQTMGSTIVSLTAVRRPTSFSDLLFVGFERMRIAILSWHPDTFSWISEQLVDLGKVLGTDLCPLDTANMGLDTKCNWRPLLRGSRGSNSDPVVRSDPSGHCVAILSRAHDILYIIPIRSDDESNMDGSRVVNFSSVFVVDLHPEYGAANIKDFTFLHGMFEPHISLLFETKRTWSGRTAVQRNTSALLTISIDLRSKRSSSSWSMDQLPYDCIKLEAVPDSARGGVLVLSSSVIMQVRHGRCVAGLSLNCYGDSYATELKSKYESIIPSDTLVECDAAHCRFLDVEDKATDSSQSIALLSLKGGELYFLHVAVDAQNIMTMKRSGSTVIASEIVPINDRFFILSSRLSDSLLIEYKRVKDKVVTNASESSQVLSISTKSDSRKNGQSSKDKSCKRKKRTRTVQEDEEYEMSYGARPPQTTEDDSDDGSDDEERTLNLNENEDQGTRGVYDDDDELRFVFKSDASAGFLQSGTNWALTVKDTIPCFGPGADIAVGPSPKDITRTQLDLVVAGGYAKNGCLAFVHQFIRPSTFTEFPVPGCEGVWTLVDPAVLRGHRKQRTQRNKEIMKRNEARRVRNVKVRESRRQFLQKAITELKEEKIQHVLASSKLVQKQVSANDNSVDKSTASSAPVAPTNCRSDSIRGEETSAGKPTHQIAKILTGKGCDNGQGADDPAHSSSNICVEEPAEKCNLPVVPLTPDELSSNLLQDQAVKSNKTNSTETINKMSDHAQVNSASEETNQLARAVQHNLKDVLSIHSGAQPLPSSTQVSEEANEPALKKLRSSDHPQPSNDSSDSMNFNVELDKDEIVKLRHEVDASIPLEEEETIESSMDGEEGFHSYMLLGLKTSTMVLSTDSDLEEIMPEDTDFVTSEKTIVAQNVFENHAVVQVVPSKVCVIMNNKLQCEYSIGAGESKIDQAQICGKLILLQTEDKHLIILNVDAEPFFEDDEDAEIFREDEFDEYGMSVSKDSNKTVGEGRKSRRKSENKRYTNFSITQDEKATDSFAHLPITSAFLYQGPLASEIVTDGVLRSSPRNSTELETDGQHPAPKLEENARAGSVVIDTEAPDQNSDASLDDEEKLLYGAMDEDLSASDKMVPSADNQLKEDGNCTSGVDDDSKENRGKIRGPEKGVAGLESVASTDNEGHLLVLSTKEGGVHIFSRQLNYSRVFHCPYFYTAPDLASDLPVGNEEEESNQFPSAKPDYEIDRIFFTEVTASYHLPGFSTPYLMFTSRFGLPVVYRAFLRPRSQTPVSRSRLCFRRISFRDGTTRWLSRLMRKSDQVLSTRRTGQVSNSCVTRGIHPILFENVCGRSGVFLAGECPAFLFAERGYPRIHELTYSNRTGQATVAWEKFEVGQSVLSFAQFHNMNCHRGFVSVGDDHVIRIGALPEKGDVNYDTPTPFCKIALRCTPHKVAYHGGSATYGVLASMPTLTTREERLARILQSLEKHDKRHYQHTAAQAEAETGDERADRVPPLFEELHELRVYRPDNWNLIRSHKLQKGEVGLAITNMKVNVYKQRTAGPGVEIPSSMKGDDGNESLFAASVKMKPKDVLVVGTGYLNGEDASSRGRLLMFEISRQEVYTEAGGAYTAFQLQLIAEKEVLSPVTAVASMEGYVIAGVGPLVSVYKLVGDEIVHLSFAFGQLYCSSIASLKQYVIVADMCKSISFMYFRERNNSVNFLAQDYEKVTCYANEFLLGNDKMGIVVSDGEGNVRMLNYAPASVAASRGKRLLLNGGIHIGSRINKFVRIRIADPEHELVTGVSRRKAGKQALMFATLDGGIGAVVGADEEDFRILQKLAKVMREYEGLRRCGGVNLEEEGMLRHRGSAVELLDQRLLDCRSVFDIMDLTLVELKRLTRMCDLSFEDFAKRLLALDAVLWRF